MDETEPIEVQAAAAPAARRVDPWKILAGVSTAVSVATIATLVWTVNKVSDDETPAERLSAAAGVTRTVNEPPAAPVPRAAEPAPVQSAPAQSVPVQAAPVGQTAPVRSPLAQYFPMQGEAAAAAASRPEPPPSAAGLPPVNFASLPAPNINVDPGLSIDAIIAAVSGTAGWVGGGTLNLLGDVIVASAMNNGGTPRPTDPLAALAAPLSKLPPPQWPRELDITKIPPPHIHWDRLLPRF